MPEPSQLNFQTIDQSSKPPGERVHHDRPANDGGPGVLLVFVLMVWAGIVWFSHHRYAPSDLVGLNSPATKFSAVQAEPIFRRLYEDAKPHPAGENEAFRQKVLEEFRRLGYKVEQQVTSSPVRNKRSDAESVPLVNLIVRLEGRTDKPPVMLTAHYDSTGQSPGAADDGVGLTALIEIARILRDEPLLDRAIIFLVTDGEEYGLLGARKFVEEHPLANEIAAVVNLEARGTSGPSIMFETSPDSAWLVDMFARNSKRPFGSSLFYEIYRRLPNDTDFSVFNEHGIKGFNFAFIGDVKNYHTPNDNFETVDRRSLQHHGENALPLIRELANTDIEARPATRAVYFDLFGYGLIRWPALFSIGLAIAGLILVFWFSAWVSKREEQGSNQAAIKPSHSMALVAVTLVAIFLIGKLVDAGFTLDGILDSLWPVQPIPIQMTFWAFGLTVVLAIGWLFRNKMSWRATWFSVWLTWSVLAVGSSLMLVGASHLFIVPLLCTGVASLMAIFVGGHSSHRQAIFVSCAGLIGIGLIWMPLERLFYDAVGFRMNQLLILRMSLMLTSLLPLLTLISRRALGVWTSTSLLVSVGLTLWSVLAN